MAYNDRTLQFAILIILSFLMINFDIQTSQIFIVFGLISEALYYTDNFVRYKTEQPGSNRYLEVMWAVVSYVIFTFATTVALAFFKFVSSLAGSSFSIFNEALFQSFSQVTPALANILFISLAVWGILIPLVETDFFFGRLFEFMADTSKIPIHYSNLYNLGNRSLLLKTWALIILSASAFMLFHLTAKGITNNSALLAVFMFGIVSQIMVIVFNQTVEAKIMHIIANTTALLIGTGVQYTNIVVIGVLAVPIIIHFFPQLQIMKRVRLSV